MTDASAPRPVPDADSRPFWEALQQRRVTFQRCRSCGEAQLYFRALCKHCQSPEIDIEESSGLGTVYSFTIVHRVGNPILNDQTPYVLAIVEMAEGPRVVTRIETDPGDVAVGDEVTATFRQLDDQTTLLYYAPVE